MPTLDEIVARATNSGYPIAENEFTVTKQNPAPTLPFICYQKVERHTGTDHEIKIKTTEISFEFYTDRKPDEKDKAAIARFEKEVLPDIDFVKTQTFINEENMTMTAYELTTVEKIRKGT